MVAYFQKRVETAQVGGCVVSVQCDKCDCRYFYELTRIGSGSEIAPYGVGAARATRSAEEQSEEDLQNRLEFEAELVPCPECHWINDEIVQGYRLGRYRRFGKFALGVGFVGTVGSLFCAWFISIGLPADRGALSYFLIGGPIFFAFLAASIVLFRNWMRSRIQPNRDFPRSPKLPIGSPSALISDASSGQLRPAEPEQQSLHVNGDWQHYQIGRHSLPFLCCGCLQDASAEHSYECEASGIISLEVPRCADCAGRSQKRYGRIWFLTAGVGLLAGSAAILPLNLDSAEFWIITSVSLLILCALASFVASTMTAPVKVARGDQARGVVRLRFRNADYGHAVAMHTRDFSEASIQSYGAAGVSH